MTDADDATVLQATDCILFQKHLKKAKICSDHIKKCVECSKNQKDACRFRHIRRVSKTSAVVDLLGGRYTRFAERSNERERLDYVYDRPFAPEITRRDVAFLQLYVSRALLPIVNHTLAILDAFPSRACPISRSASYRDDCDKCNWTLLLAYWMCIGCGRFTCTTCETASQRCRCDSEQILMSIVDPAEIRFLSTELQDLVSRVPPSSHHALSNSLSEPTIAEALDESIRSVPILSQRCSLGDFDLLWDQGIPFVVRDQAPGLRCDWSPAGLADVLGSDWCKVADCEDENYLKTALVDEFLLGLDEWNDRVLKLKDYPTDQRLKSKSFILARDFQLALPVPAYSSEDGPLNIVNFFPINYSNAPDLGPKMYAAMASKFGDEGHGSTRLHIDISDAVNIMARGEALWHVFLSKDADQLKKYVGTKCKGPWLNDNTFLNQYHKYLTPTDLAELKELGIIPFTFRQCQGDVVFIPAGSPHQVSNITPCVKLAADFLAPQSLERCSKVNSLMHASKSNDVLEFGYLIIHCWMALSQLSKSLPASPKIPPSISLPDIAAGNPAAAVPQSRMCTDHESTPEPPMNDQIPTRTEVIHSEILTDDQSVETQTSDVDSSYRDVNPPNTQGITPLSRKIDTAVQQALEKFGLHQNVPQGPHYPYSPYPHAPPYHHYPSVLPYQMPAPYVMNNATPFPVCYPSVPQILPPFVAPFPQQTFPSQNLPPVFVFKSAFQLHTLTLRLYLPVPRAAPYRNH
ncbi:hypothetical protein AB1N83_013032 [Pleurotus pulmonarius]